ncbi:hypothetical protein LS68_005090 [Helicobacter sp. MIT 05-5293]|uniref:hypothetical protein n=1 Tax=Helicobacter sp. MIT 05-5293 TaxID=1548149 RepID=UPI0006896A68|nr:hypothetical protein [Helicobacter sp. MIT 05-5293]TLD80855.1 hypothetical protein LS68_005090 [Helicobacter sp. MIT 05-5293]
MQTQKNYWPLAIIGVIIFGVIMVSISITIALKNPIQDDNAYFTKKRIVDENINQLLIDQDIFDASFNRYLDILDSSDATLVRDTNLLSPYQSKPHRDKFNPKFPTQAFIDKQNIRLALNLIPQKAESPSEIHIKAYLDSYHQANALQDLGELIADGVENTRYLSSAFKIPKGRWKLIFEITYDTDHKAYLETELFVDMVDIS